MRVLGVLVLAMLLAGCSIGKGYIFEPTGMTKCVVASAESGEITVETPLNAYGSIYMKGENVKYHGVHKDYCDSKDHQ